MEPKTWEKHEIIELIRTEIEACQSSQNPADRKSDSMAELIYGVLDNEHLIEHTP